MEYSEEENKAIKEELQSFIQKYEPYVFYSKQHGDTAEINSYIKRFDNYRKILNLIEKQKKEIEELERYKSVYENLRKEFDKLTEKVLGKDYYNYGCDTYICDKYTCEDIARKKVKILFKDKNSIPKEAIREKIEYYKKQNNDLDDYTNEIEALEELLGEDKLCIKE